MRIGPALRFGFREFGQRPGYYAGVVGTLFLSWALLELLVFATQRLGIVANVLLHLLFLVLFSGLKLGFLRLALAARDGGRPVYRELFTLLRRGPRFFAAGVIYLTLILLGLALLVAPGVYLGLRLSPFGFRMAEHDAAIVDTFRSAAELTRGSLPSLLRLALALTLLNLVGAALLGLGLVVTVPVSFLSAAAVYRELQARTGERPAPA